MLRRKNLRAEKILYPDGIGCCIWHTYPDVTDDEDFGSCWDFAFDQLEDVIALLEELRGAPATAYDGD